MRAHRRRAPRAPAPAAHRGRPAAAGGAHLRAARQPVHARSSARPGTPTTSDWVIPDEAVDEPDFRWATWFGREAPLVVEIGSGVGETTAALAPARAAYDVLAFEVWRPGIADALARVVETGATNVRFCSVDAVWSTEHLLGPGETGRALDVLPRPVAQEEAPQAPAGDAGVRRPGRDPAGARGRVAAGHRLGRLRRADGRGARRRAAARPAGWCRGGTNVRSPSSSARASPPAGRSPT